MDKNAIKKYAVWSRRELIARVSQKALRYEITAEGCGDANADSAHGTLLSGAEKKQRQALIAQIKEKSFEQVMEEVAYTWFNRFSALRFMEVNGYLPSHVRVFTDEDNNFKPQIITEAIHLELDGLNMEKVYALKDENKTDELYKYLLITQCNALSSILPGMFQRLSDYTELLFPENLLRDGSVIQQMIELIPEEDWKDAVQIIGWLYQYYNSEKKDDVFAALKKNVKITKENIPAATQLFTPDWIVRYMVENSLGRLWVEGHPNDGLKAGWKYYLEEADQEPAVEEQLARIRKEYEGLKPEDIKCIDPCCGSGHILAYLFDVLMQIYEAYGYTTREAVASIVENNIFGLDIDDRAAQLANFAIMMKARQYDRRFFSHAVQPKVYAIAESNHIDSYTIDYFANGDAKLEKAIKTIVTEMHDAKEYGSILTITPQDWTALHKRFEEIEQDTSMYREIVMTDLLQVVEVARALAQKYDIVTTNPPYMANKGINVRLADLIKSNYESYKADLFAIFIVRCSNLCKKTGFMGFLTPYVWMFIQSYEKLREYIVGNSVIENLIQFEYSAFEEATVPICTFSIRNYKINKVSTFLRLTDFRGGMEIQREKALEGISNHSCGYYYVKNQADFTVIPGTPIAFWASENLIKAFESSDNLGSLAEPRGGLSTTDNARFLRYWQEVVYQNIAFDVNDTFETEEREEVWCPIAKGGEYRKWYGNNDYIVKWYHNGEEIKHHVVNNPNDPNTTSWSRRIFNYTYYFHPCVTWSGISSGKLSVRMATNQIFGGGGKALFSDVNLEYFCALLNSKVALNYLTFISPTLNYESGHIAKIPVVINDLKINEVINIVKKCTELSKKDWDSFETSWDFIRHPLISVITKNRMLFDDISNIDVAECFMVWENECKERFNQLKANEEELNRIFIDIYGLQDELTPEVEDKEVTVRKADLQRDIKGLISYAVGCMFGRYSLYNEGLLYAGGVGGDYGSLVEKIQDKLKENGQCMFPENEFYPVSGNIIPICDDEYFTDDIVGKFVQFIKVVYGEKTFNENLKFIAEVLGGKGQPIDVIRNYFINDFYADHCKIYQKRPIYWLFDSGKKGGFKALIYMHRYQQDTIARMRTDYVHEQQGRYRTEISDLETRIAGASTSERVKLNKQLSALQDKAAEIRQYEEKIHHLADQMIRIDLDDGVKNNYAIFQDVLAKIK